MKKKGSLHGFVEFILKIFSFPIPSPVNPHGIDGASLHLLMFGHFPAETFVVSPERGCITLTTNVGAFSRGVRKL